MNEYLLLYGFALVAIVSAVVQDIKTREISNWVTFSLIAFVLAYRGFYSIYSNNIMFFFYGLIGVILFVALGHLFYYSRIFAGGDAKLLFGLGGIFPYSSFADYIYYGIGFVLLLFTAGAIYTLVYSAFLAKKNYNSFKIYFVKNILKVKLYFLISFILALSLYYISDFVFVFKIILFFIVLLSPILFAYVKAIESSCMISLVGADKLTEGDWLERDVSVNGRKIKKSFSGLTYDEILLLRKAKKNVWIKTGVPFAPAFLIALLIFLRYSSWKFF